MGPYFTKKLGPYCRGEYFYSFGVPRLQMICFFVQKYSIWSVSCKNIHIMVYCAKILVKYCYMSLEYFLKPWKMRQNNELHADLASFLFNCARKGAFWGGLCRNTTFFGVRAEILLFQVIAPPKSCAGPFLGVVQKY